MNYRVFSKRVKHFVIEYLLKNVYQNKTDFTSINLKTIKKNLYLINFFNELHNIDLNQNDTYTMSVNKFNIKTNKCIKVQK